MKLLLDTHIAVPIQMEYNVKSLGVGARHAVPLRVYLTSTITAIYSYDLLVAIKNYQFIYKIAFVI